MCGIAGLLAISPETPVDATERVEKMLEALAHRGPDDEGLYEQSSVVLGHRRLAILDVSTRGHQPMIFGDLVVVFNGEIYNFIELRESLQRVGHEFHTGTDTEVLLHAYEEWGIACLERMTGMWAFVLVDRARGSVHLARDRFGIKPLYFARDGQVVLFASEIKAILAAGFPACANVSVISSYLVVGQTTHSEETFFAGVEQILPGQYAHLDLQSGQWTLSSYYRLVDVVPASAGADAYRETLQRAVEVHLRSDVPVGTCLSGGLDSSTIAALAARGLQQTGRRLTAITAKSEARHNDESAYAREVVEHCKLNWEVVEPRYEDFQEHLERCLLHQDEPCLGPSVLLQYCVMKRARECGLKVMLDGQGGDECLLGYERYYTAYFWHLLKRLRWGRLFKEFFLAARNSRLGLRQVASYAAYFLILPLRKAVLRRRVAFLKPEFLELGLEGLGRSQLRFFRLRSLQIQELIADQLPHLLQYEDRNSMAHSIEARVPFVDHRCIETAVALAPEDKIRDGFTKFPLRGLAAEVLPESIAWRRSKCGFEAPAELWLGRHRVEMERAVRESALLDGLCRKAPRLEDLTLDIQWRLYNLAVWERLFEVKLDVEMGKLKESHCRDTRRRSFMKCFRGW